MKYKFYLFVVLLVFMVSCTKPGTMPQQVHEKMNSVYFWKTVFHLDSNDLAFVERHDIRRLYLRLFDVVPANSNVVEYKTEPNASVRIDWNDFCLIRDLLKEKEFIPVVYITLEALKAMSGHEDELASNIVTRVRNMCQYNELPNVAELQIDCDWTATTENSFFELCKSIRIQMEKLQLPWRLSSTIRLHQLSRKVPPVDAGVLMVYNTGSFNDPDTENSIISTSDVKPYLKHLSTYPLHLDVAYPTYSWQLLFRKRQFVGLLNELKLNDSTRFERIGDHIYVSRRDLPYRNRIIMTGDIIREETSSFEDIVEVKKLIEGELSDRHHSNILYHLDSNNLSKYTSNEIDKIFSTNR